MTLSIKDHIDQGHYPKDSAGRSLVPKLGGGTFTVVCTDKPGNCPILGWHEKGDNFAYYANTQDLLPPPPRRIPEVVTLCIRKGDGFRQYEPGDITSCGEENKEWQYVLLKGEREESWS